MGEEVKISILESLRNTAMKDWDIEMYKYRIELVKCDILDWDKEYSCIEAEINKLIESQRQINIKKAKANEYISLMCRNRNKAFPNAEG